MEVKEQPTKLNLQKVEDTVRAVLWLRLPDESTGAPAALIDAGVILAQVGRRDKWHQACVLALDHSRLPLLTTEAVRTEVFHFARRDVVDSRGVLRLLLAGAIRMAPITNEDRAQIESLMDEYAARPMDFADATPATLVRFAARERLSTILTIDHDDFGNLSPARTQEIHDPSA
jgi:uncharacterized protein